MRKYVGSSIAVLTICLLTQLAGADDWGQWRGANRAGLWLEEGLLEQLPDGPLPEMWSVDIGPGYSGPTVADGRVYVMDRQVGSDENGGRETERVLCFDSNTGDSVWTVEYEAPYTISYKAGPRASVTIDGDRAYTMGAMGHFHCLNGATGAVIWKKDLKEAYEVEMPIWGIAASPLIYKDLVIAQVAAADGACVVAFNKMTGEEVWRALDEKAGYSSPVLIKQGDKDVVVCWTGESLSGVDASSGEVYWSYEMRPSRMPIGIATPSIDGEYIFVSSFYDGSLMIRASKDAPTSELVWRACGVDEKSTGTSSVQLAGGKELKGEKDEFGVHAMIGTPLVEKGFIYAVDSYGEFRCLEATTGRRVWESADAVPRNRWAAVHMVRQADRVWMFNEAGELLIGKVSPKGLAIQSRSALIEPTKIQLNRRDGVCWSHPAFAEKSVFVRNDERLIRVSLAKD